MCGTVFRMKSTLLVTLVFALLNASPAFAQTEESFNGVQGQAIDNQKHRSAKTSALIIAGSAGLGSSVGKMTGKKNADLIGAIAGGVAGLIYDRLTYKNPHGL